VTLFYLTVVILWLVVSCDHNKGSVGGVHPEMKLLLSFAHPDVVMISYVFTIKA